MTDLKTEGANWTDLYQSIVQGHSSDLVNVIREYIMTNSDVLEDPTESKVRAILRDALPVLFPENVAKRWPNVATVEGLAALHQMNVANETLRAEAKAEDDETTVQYLDGLMGRYLKGQQPSMWHWLAELLSVSEPHLPLDPGLLEERHAWYSALANLQRVALGSTTWAMPLLLTASGSDLLTTELDPDEGVNTLLIRPTDQVILWRNVELEQSDLDRLGGPSDYDKVEGYGNSERPEEGGEVTITSRLGFVYPGQALLENDPLPTLVLHQLDDGWARIAPEDVMELVPHLHHMPDGNQVQIE